jgi:acyl carrier protein
MNDEELKKLIERTLFEVAPDLEGETIIPTESFADQFGIDSMDFHHFIVGLHVATGIEIPEAEYNQLTTLEDCLKYLKIHQN